MEILESILVLQVSNSVTFNQLPADQIKLGGASTTIVDQSRLLVYKNANFLGRNFACHQSTAYADLHHLARGFRTSSTVELQKPKRKWQFRLDSQILWGLHKASDRCWRIMRRAQSSTQECQHAFQVIFVSPFQSTAMTEAFPEVCIASST